MKSKKLIGLTGKSVLRGRVARLTGVLALALLAAAGMAAELAGQTVTSGTAPKSALGTTSASAPAPIPAPKATPMPQATATSLPQNISALPPELRDAVRLLGSADPKTRTQAALKLGQFMNPASMPVLIEALGDPDTKVSDAALHALYAINPTVMNLGENRDSWRAWWTKADALWGEPVTGVRAHLYCFQRPYRELNLSGDDQIWNDGNPPVLWLDLRNDGARDLSFGNAPEDIAVQIDGQTFSRPARTGGETLILGGGERRNGIGLVLDRQWRFGSAPLHWAPGRHTVSMTVTLQPASAGGGRTLRLLSNLVSLNILDNPHGPYQVDQFKIEAGFAPDKKEALLGEEITASFFVKNTGSTTFTLETGGDGSGYRPQHLFFHGVDASGNAVADPQPNAWNFGGPGGRETMRPGDALTESVPLSRWCAFTAPGVYTITSSGTLQLAASEDQFRIDRDENKLRQPSFVTSFTLTLREPTPEEARRILKQRRGDDDPVVRTSGVPPADTIYGSYSENGRQLGSSGLTSLRAPLYLPLLREDANKGDLEAIEAIGEIMTPEATRALLELARTHLDNSLTTPALTSLKQAIRRLPDPMYQSFQNEPTTWTMVKEMASGRLRVERAWRPEMTGQALALARRLAGGTDPDGQGLADSILRDIGTAQDMPLAIRAFNRAVAAMKGLTLKEMNDGGADADNYTIRVLLDRGGAVPARPANPGEAAAWLTALGTRKDFRPPGWQQTLLRWLDSDIPTMKVLVLENLPDPPLDEVLARLPEWLADPYVGLQVAACKIACNHPRTVYREPLLKILRTGEEGHMIDGGFVLDEAIQAALANGITADLVMEVWLDRMDSENPMGDENWLGRVMKAALDITGLTHDYNTPSKDLDAARAGWRRFIVDNREKLRQGRKFKPGDPELSPNLFPPGFSDYYDKMRRPETEKPKMR